MTTGRRIIMGLLALALVGGPTLAALGFQATAGSTGSMGTTPAPSGSPETSMASVPDGSLAELAGFASNLPLVVIDANPDDFHVHSVWDTDLGYFVPVGYDPYVKGTLSVIDNPGGTNRLADAPAQTTAMKARVRGSSSQTFPKQQYDIRLLADEGGPRSVDILGLGSATDWVLNISFIDKSLLRNYLAYTLAGRIMDHTPKVRYCEVFFRDGAVYRYRGLYLMIQAVQVSESMVPLTPYDPHFAETAYLVRRDRYRPNDVMLDTEGTTGGWTPEFVGVIYPPKQTLTKASIDYITADINSFEAALVADDDASFLTYADHIDTDSFVDYFVFNEFLGNYDAGIHSVYAYKDLTGKLTLGPVWDFDRAIGNDYPNHFKTDSTAMHDAAWFKQILRDGAFVERVVNRYAGLRAGVLSDAGIEALVDTTVAAIHDAQVRDWNRWDYLGVYDASLTGPVKAGQLPLTGDRLDYPATVERLVSTLEEHAHWMDAHLDSLYQFSTIGPDRDRTPAWYGPAGFILLVVAFFAGLHLVQRGR